MLLPNQKIRVLYVILPLSSPTSSIVTTTADTETTENNVNTININHNNDNSSKTLLLTKAGHNNDILQTKKKTKTLWKNILSSRFFHNNNIKNKNDSRKSDIIASSTITNSTSVIPVDLADDIQQGIFQSSNNNVNNKFHIQYTTAMNETLELLSNNNITECCYFDILIVSITEYDIIIISNIDNTNNINKPLQELITEVNDIFHLFSSKFPSTLRIVSCHNHHYHELVDMTTSSLSSRSIPVVSQSMNVTNILQSMFLNKGRADAVIESYEQLERVIHLYFFYRDSKNNKIIESTSTEMSNSTHNKDTTNDHNHKLVLLSSFHVPSTFFQVTHDIMKQREVSLRTMSNNITTFRIQHRVYISTPLQRQMNDIDQQQQKNLFCLQKQQQNNNRNDDHVVQLLRIVHISDTHNQHRNIHIPCASYGDLFIHSGDICGYYHHSTNIVEHFYDFLLWLHTDICPYFHRVIFIGGNHDIYLDPLHESRAYTNDYNDTNVVLQQFLNDHPNVSYLYNEMIQYNGLNIYGTPFVACREELLNKQYLSDGFERTKKERIDHWKNHVPKNIIDILITHCPPDIIGVSDSTNGCPIMTQYIYGLESTTTTEIKRPILHCFGHVHDMFGIYSYRSSSNNNNNNNNNPVTLQSRTILVNGSQRNVIYSDPVGGGVPVVIDLPFTKQSHK